MKFKFPLIAAFISVLALSACGGGSDSPAVTPPPPAVGLTVLTKTDTTVGTGAEAVNGSLVSVHYTGWLYSTTAAGNKGTQFDTSSGKTPLQFTVGSKALIDGFEQGVLGMKVGGKRTLLIPAKLAYGEKGNGAAIPANADVMFEVELVAIAPAPASPAALTKTDIVVGSGAEATAGKVVTVNYTGWLYSATGAGNKGTQFDTNAGKTPLQFTLGSKALIDGFEQGTLGMKVGGKRTVLIPSALGYGDKANGPIPANSGLVFEIELLTVK